MDIHIELVLEFHKKKWRPMEQKKRQGFQSKISNKKKKKYILGERLKYTYKSKSKNELM